MAMKSLDDLAKVLGAAQVYLKEALAVQVRARADVVTARKENKAALLALKAALGGLVGKPRKRKAKAAASGANGHTAGDPAGAPAQTGAPLS